MWYLYWNQRLFTYGRGHLAPWIFVTTNAGLWRESWLEGQPPSIRRSWFPQQVRLLQHSPLQQNINQNFQLTYHQVRSPIPSLEKIVS